MQWFPSCESLRLLRILHCVPTRWRLGFNHCSLEAGFSFVNGFWKLGWRWDSSPGRTTGSFGRYLHLNPCLHKMLTGPHTRTTKKSPMHFHSFFPGSTTTYQDTLCSQFCICGLPLTSAHQSPPSFLCPEYRPTPASVFVNTLIRLHGVFHLLSFLPECHHTSSNLRRLWHLFLMCHQERKSAAKKPMACRWV